MRKLGELFDIVVFFSVVLLAIPFAFIITIMKLANALATHKLAEWKSEI